MNEKIDAGLQKNIIRILDEIYEDAEKIAYADSMNKEWGLSLEFIEALQELTDKCSQASSAFTNIITCLAIKVTVPKIDVRVHQVQIGAPFSFRWVSEHVIYPWLSAKGFEGAKSGWQTRTMERPKPYRMDYDENIQFVKKPFLLCFDRVETHKENPSRALLYLFVKQIELRDKKSIELACPQVDDIEIIVSYFSSHFFKAYKSKGAARLPVLALYAVYDCLLKELARFQDCLLAPLQEHSAADTQTGSAGDIEVKKKDGSTFETVEIKHNIPAAALNVHDLFKKIAPHRLDRFYWLTTSSTCTVNDEQNKDINDLKARLGCQVIVNGLIPTLRYYLRLMAKPSSIFPMYLSLIKTDRSLSHEHRVAWNDIISGRNS